MAHIDAPFPHKKRKVRQRKVRLDSEGNPKPKRSLPLWAETIVLLLIALVLAVVIKQFFVQAFYIPSGSMEPGLVPNDRILVEKWSYWMGSPKRGDIVVFSDPGNWLQGENAQQSSNFFTSTLGAVGLYPVGGHLVKRVIGTAGDHVSCDPTKNDGRIMINGVAIDESSYLAHDVVIPDGKTPLDIPSVSPCDEPFSAVVPAGRLWVMGDNRGDSSDSRVHQMQMPDCGFVPVKDVVGKVFAVVWPMSHMKFVHRPSNFDKVPAPATAAPAMPSATQTCPAG